MEAPVARIVVLRLASRTHLEPSHRGLWPVVGNAARDGEPRPAVGAVQKWIPVAPVGRVKQLAQAVWASRRIRWNPSAHPAQNLAGNDLKARIAGRRQLTRSNGIDSGQRRSLGAQALQKRFHTICRPLNLDRHAIRIVANEPGQALFQRQPVDKRSEPNALHYAADKRFAPHAYWLGLVSHGQASYRKQA